MLELLMRVVVTTLLSQLCLCEDLLLELLMRVVVIILLILFNDVTMLIIHDMLVA